MAEVITFIKTVAGSDGGAFAIMAMFIVLAFWLYGKFVKLVAKNEQTQSCCTKLDAKTDSLSAEINLIKGDMQFVKSTLNNIVNMLQSEKGSMVKANSPLSLTDIGKQAAVDMKAEDAVAVNWEKIRAIMDAEIADKNPYDIQTYCLEKITVAPERFFEQPTLDAFKIYAYRNGRTLFECMKVIGIIVRDKYFSVNSIPLASLDAPQPAKK